MFGVETINIPLDPISHNLFYLNSVNPVYQNDLADRVYVVDGNIGPAISVYLLDDIYLNTSDSVRTTSSFLYKQGDFGYNDFTLDMKTTVSDSGTLGFIGNGINYPGKFSQYTGVNDNLLQNYLLSFSKRFNSSKFSFYTGYHLENKSAQHINSNSGESYFSGFNYGIIKGRYNLDFRYGFQLGQANFVESATFLKNHNINWLLLSFKYLIHDRIEFQVNNNYKDIYLDENYYDINKFSSYLLFDSELNQMQIGFNMLDSNIYPDININTKFKSFNIRLGASSDSWFDSGSRIRKSYQYYYSSFSFKNNNLDIEIQPRYIDYNNNPYLSIQNKFDLNCNLINSEIKVIPSYLHIYKTKALLSMQTNYYHKTDLILTNYLDISLKLFEVESSNRYKKFLSVSYKGIQFNNIYSINLNEPNLYSNGAWSWNDNKLKNYLDFQIGLEFEKFIFSYHFTNILSENYMINSSGDIHDFYMKYFSVQWKFDN